MKNIKKILIIVLVLFEVFSLHLMYKSYNNKNILEDKNTNLLQNNNKIAIKVQNDSGSYEDRTTFPGAGYTLNKSMTECVDQNGSPISVSSLITDGSTVTINSKYTAYCTLYFKKGSNEPPIVTQLREANTSSNLSEELVGGMYRYQGTTGVNNYICFGTTVSRNCTSGSDASGTGVDKYLYRIIGITPEGYIKVIKETFARTTSTNLFAMHTTASGNIEQNAFSAIQKLNGNDRSDNIFLMNPYYDYLLPSDPTWLNKIVNYNWFYGSTTSNGSYNGDTMYGIEGAFTNSLEDTKIGLISLSDYYYAYPSGNPGSSGARASWIFYASDGYNNSQYGEWTFTRYGVDSGVNKVWKIWPMTTSVMAENVTTALGMRPVFYLDKNVKIISNGLTNNGSKTAPFMVDSTSSGTTDQLSCTITQTQTSTGIRFTLVTSGNVASKHLIAGRATGIGSSCGTCNPPSTYNGKSWADLATQSGESFENGNICACGVVKDSSGKTATCTIGNYTTAA